MLAFVLTALAGCDSTQQQAARARLKGIRAIASESPTVVRRANQDVRVVGVTLLRGPWGAVITVRLRNHASHPLNDLPISVGIVSSRRRMYLNAAANVDYFKTHLASIGARSSVTWVFSTPRQSPAAASPFAVVGTRPSVPATAVRALPRIEIAQTRRAPGSSLGPRVRLTVTNASAVPQYQLQVYALGLERGRYVAAGRATVSHLGTGSSETLELSLLGARRETSLQLEALPTMFQ